MDVKVLQQYHLLLWHHAAVSFEASDFEKALMWYNYSLSLFPPEDNKNSNIAKLHVSKNMYLVIFNGLWRL